MNAHDLIKPAAPSASLMALRLRKQVYRLSDEGDLEKRCSRCKEYWPADSEFFYSNSGKGDGLSEHCKACYIENRYPAGRGCVDHQFNARAS